VPQDPVLKHKVPMVVIHSMLVIQLHTLMLCKFDCWEWS
jgi:hypothetical protein